MNEKDMVNDILSQVNSNLEKYTGIISHTANSQLRQTLQDMRNNVEQFQYQLLKCAQNKKYYFLADMATEHEIQCVKSLFKRLKLY